MARTGRKKGLSTLLAERIGAHCVGMQYTTARDVMSHVEFTAEPGTTVAQAWELMRATGARLLPVVVDGRCTGIATERGLIDTAAPGVPKDCELPLRDAIGYPPLGILPDDDLWVVLQEIASNDDGVLVVADLNGTMLGVITCLDAIAAAARRLRHPAHAAGVSG